MLEEISKLADVYILTFDTFGTVQKECKDINGQVQVLNPRKGGEEKRRFVFNLGAESTICIGNGMNDAGMFDVSTLAIIIIGEEGCSVKALAKADIVVKNSEDALMLLLNPMRITATLRG